MRLSVAVLALLGVLALIAVPIFAQVRAACFVDLGFLLLTLSVPRVIVRAALW